MTNEPSTIRGGNPDVQALVRSRVKDLLSRSHAFGQLPPDQQNQVAHDMTQVAAYLAAPEAIPANTLPGAVAIVQDGREALGTLLGEIDFPNFVSSLVRGVFQAIVDASIQQMNAYATLVSNVAQTVSEFLQDSVSDDDGRRFLAATYPEYFELDPNLECHVLRLRNHLPKSEAIGRLSYLPLEAPLHSLDPHEIDRILIPGARRRLAVNRQQMLSSMVMMGINRLVVTDGQVIVPRTLR